MQILTSFLIRFVAIGSVKQRPKSSSTPLLAVHDSSMIYIAVVGVGLVGKEFIDQLSLVSSTQSFKLVYISNSKTSVLNKSNGIPFAEYQKLLASSNLLAAPKQLDAEFSPEELKANKDALIIVDNTSSEQIAGLYPGWLKRGYSVVTPNKKAFSSGLELAQQIRDALVRNASAAVGKESTVGAGLPIIGTLRTLVETGDEVCPTQSIYVIASLCGNPQAVRQYGGFPWIVGHAIAIARE